MISKGLKVGATFEDGGLTYEITKVLPNGDYESKRIEKPAESAGKKSAKAEKTEKPAE